MTSQCPGPEIRKVTLHSEVSWPDHIGGDWILPKGNHEFHAYYTRIDSQEWQKEYYKIKIKRLNGQFEGAMMPVILFEEMKKKGDLFAK